MDLFEYYHAPPIVAFRGRSLTLQLILPDEEKVLEAVSLVYSVEGSGQSGTLRMLPVDGLVNGESYSVYAATVSANTLGEGERLTYRFLREGEESAEYFVPLTDAPDETDTADTAVPAILPLAPTGRVHLTNGDLGICFAVAGKEISTPTVYVKENGVFVPYLAEPNRQGAYAATVPFASLSRMERLQYYIEVKGAQYTASLGNADAPRVARIKDNAGPAILQTYPVEGQVLEKELHPQIRLDYFDISGVNLRTSILCVDGRNVSASAQWEQGSVSYRPEKALAYGEHTVEISLRDKLGNRTYRKIAFGICDGTEVDGEQKAKMPRKVVKKISKASAVPLQAAKIIAGAISTLKDIFSARK